MKEKKIAGVTRRHTIPVTQKHIDSALLADSSRCMVSDAIGDYFTVKGMQTTNRLTDLRTIRATFRENGVRGIAITPLPVALALAQWDVGVKPEPFTFRLEFTQFVKSGGGRMRHVDGLPRGRKAKLDEDGTSRRGDGVPVVLGGLAPPLGPLSNDKKRKSIGMRRAFGVRGLARLLNGEDVT